MHDLEPLRRSGARTDGRGDKLIDNGCTDQRDGCNSHTFKMPA